MEQLEVSTHHQQISLTSTYQGSIYHPRSHAVYPMWNYRRNAKERLPQLVAPLLSWRELLRATAPMMSMKWSFRTLYIRISEVKTFHVGRS
ncbi:unnamed protein product [Urochloa humidicola]